MQYVPCLDAFIKDILCGNCYATMADEIVRRTNGKKKPEGNGNVPTGIIGAILGALLGGAVWVLIYRFGYITALGGGLIVILALRSVPAYFAYSEVQINVLCDLVLSYAFMIWGAWSSVKRTYAENNVQTKNRKVAHVTGEQISR